MMRNKLILLIVLVLVVFHWFADAFMTTFSPEPLTFTQSLLTDVPEYKLYVRIYVTAMLVSLGIVVVLVFNYRQKAHEAIQENEGLYQVAFNQAAVGFAHLGIDGQFLRVNQKCCEIVECTKESILQKKFWEFTHPDDFKQYEEIIGELLSGKRKNVFVEKRIKYCNKLWGWANLGITVVRKKNTEPDYFNLIIEDITEKKKLVTALQLNEERYKGIFQSTASCIAVYKPINDGEDFVIVDFNHMAEKVENVKKETVIGKKVTEVFPGVKKFGLLDILREAMKTGETIEQPTSFYEDEQIKGFRENKVYILSTGEIVAVYQDVTDRKLNEERLLFQAQILDQIQDKITATNLDGQIQYVNKAECETFEVTSDEQLVGKNVFDCDGSEKFSMTQQEIIEKTVSSGSWREEVVRNDKKKGEMILDFRTQLIFDKQGKPFGIVSISSDITQLKKNEESLKESEERFRELAELLPEAVFECDVNLNLTYINRRAYELFGFTEDDFKQGLNGIVMIAPEDTDKAVSNAMKRINNKEHGSTEYIALRKNGARFPILLHTSPNIKGGDIVGLRGIVVDMTKTKEAEQELKTAKEIQDAILASTDVSLAYLDTNFNFIAVNEAYAKAGNKDREFYIGKNHFDLYPHEENEEIFRKAVLTGEKQTQTAQSFEYPDQPDRGITYWDWSINPIKDETGTVQSLILSSVDVTKKVKAEEQIKELEEQIRQAQKMEAIGMLAGGIAHDFNNILNVILGYSELLMSRFMTDDQTYKKVDAIKKNAERASNLTRQLLAFSRKQILNTESMIVNDIIRDMEKMLKRIIGENIEFITELQDDLFSVKADRGQIEQIIMNLAVNSKDAMPQGGKLVIETKNVNIDEEYGNQYTDLKTGNHVMITISDNGLGIPKKVLDKIFEPFFTTKEHGKGTGLGLSTVYGIVKQSKGNIYVQSDLEKGTTFRLYFPAEKIEAVQKESAKSESQINRQELSILVVEDNKSMCNMIGEILELEGYKSFLVTNPIDAISVYKKHRDKINLLLTDVIMPEISGKKLADSLQEINPDLKVLFMSGYTDSAIVHQGILEEGTHFIQKPFMVKDLLKKIHLTLEG